MFDSTCDVLYPITEWSLYNSVKSFSSIGRRFKLWWLRDKREVVKLSSGNYKSRPKGNRVQSTTCRKSSS